MSAPDFSNLLAVLQHKKTDRPVLFEMMLSDSLYLRLAGSGGLLDKPMPTLTHPTAPERLTWTRRVAQAYQNAGYDYFPLLSWFTATFIFPTGPREHAASYSANEGTVIHDRDSFNRYPWPEMDAVDYSVVEAIAKEVPTGMAMMPCGPCGVLENVVALVGYEALCYMVIDDPQLTGDIFDAVGSRLFTYYQKLLSLPNVGLAMFNDDWGHRSQPMLSPENMRRFVFPWHRKMVRMAHEAGKPAVLHSCGNLDTLMDDIIDDLHYDGKHSYEDNIIPVEAAYEKWGHRIAILGGIDLDFISRSTPEAVTARCKKMLDRTAFRGGYALGTGNSVPDYVPYENYQAMIQTARV